MKRVFTVLLLLISSAISYADEKEIDIRGETDKTPRSIIQKPTVFIDDVQNTLSMKFTAQGEKYSITITDETGFTITQFEIVSDYVQQSYSIPVLNSGVYTIAIEGRNNFTGSFEI